jgi:hypothetical protein
VEANRRFRDTTSPGNHTVGEVADPEDHIHEETGSTRRST